MQELCNNICKNLCIDASDNNFFNNDYIDDNENEILKMFLIK